MFIGNVYVGLCSALLWNFSNGYWKCFYWFMFRNCSGISLKVTGNFSVQCSELLWKLSNACWKRVYRIIVRNALENL